MLLLLTTKLLLLVLDNILRLASLSLFLALSVLYMSRFLFLKYLDRAQFRGSRISACNGQTDPAGLFRKTIKRGEARKRGKMWFGL